MKFCEVLRDYMLLDDCETRRKYIESLSLINKQKLFNYCLMILFSEIYECNYSVTLGEAYRTEEQSKIYAKNGKGIVNSNHRNRLAIDLNLFDENGNYLKNSCDYELFGKFWENLGGCWGGRFNDGNHFSFSHNGVK